MTDAAQSPSDVDTLHEALKKSRGPGNFRNLFMYAPNGKKDGIQLIPVSEVTAKDEFFNIKNVTRDDLLAAHRIPPQPSNTGGFGAANTAAEVFGANEIAPLQRRFEQINEWIGDEVVRFTPYTIDRGAGAAACVLPRSGDCSSSSSQHPTSFGVLHLKLDTKQSPPRLRVLVG
jgi:capsid portal protein